MEKSFIAFISIFTFCYCYYRNFMKTILKSSGEKYKRIRESGKSLSGTGADSRTSTIKKIDK